MAQPIRPTLTAPPTPAQMAEFWVEPADLASRDLFYGAGGKEHAPDISQPFQFVSQKKGGYSPGWTVKDVRGVEWSAKLGIEAKAEVVASRLVWALGFHQPPNYYLEGWTREGGPSPGRQTGGRFRPDVPGFKKVDIWSWHQNPFVGTEPYRGALVMMLLLNNSDLKPAQNVVYELQVAREGARRWYVMRDLGHSLGETGIWYADRNNIEEFEKEKFILGVKNGLVHFNYSGLRKELFRNLTPADVRWTCERLARISDHQWNEAFRAANYDPDRAARFIARFKEKIAEGLSLKE